MRRRTLRQPFALLLVLASTASCRTSSGVSRDSAVADVAEELADLPIESTPATDVSVDLPSVPDVGVDTAIEVAPDAAPDAAPDTAVDVAVDLAKDLGAKDLGGASSGLKLSFNDCVFSEVGSVPNVFAVNGASLVATDFDHDGKVDLVVGTWPDNHVITLKGKGNGSFQIVSTKIMAAAPGSLCIADLDNDGTPDLVVGGKQTTSINVLRGGAGCSVADPVSYAGPTVSGIAAGDLDGDGSIDLVVGNADSLGSVGVFRGSPTGALAPITYFTSKYSPHSPVLGDFDRDGHLDIAVLVSAINPAMDDGVFILRGLGDGNFAPAVAYPTLPGPWQIFVADFTSDGILDVIILFSGDSRSMIMVGNGDSTFQTPRILGTTAVSSSWATADFDLDGHLDLATIESNQLEIFLGHGDGTFSQGVEFWTSGYGALITTDFDGDGKPDLVIAEASVGGIGEVCALKNTSSASSTK